MARLQGALPAKLMIMHKDNSFWHKGKLLARFRASIQTFIRQVYKRIAALLITWVGVTLVETYYPHLDFSRLETAITLVSFFI